MSVDTGDGARIQHIFLESPGQMHNKNIPITLKEEEKRKTQLLHL